MNFNDTQGKKEKDEAFGPHSFSRERVIFLNSFIYFWLLWVLLAARGLSLVVMSRGYSLVAVRGPLIVGDFSCCRAQSLEHLGFSSCSMQAQ